MTTTTVQYEIIDGPSADRIIDSFKYAYNRDVNVEIEFTLVPHNSRLRGTLGHRKVSTVINGLRYESGTPGMFILWILVNMPHHRQADKGGFYNANTRKGFLEFEVPTEHVDRFQN